MSKTQKVSEGGYCIPMSQKILSGLKVGSYEGMGEKGKSRFYLEFIYLMLGFLNNTEFPFH